MSNTKIVIDKEKVGKSEHSEIINAAISVLIKHGVATTITDDDIEKRANDLFSANDGFFKSIDKEAVIKFATELLTKFKNR